MRREFRCGLSVLLFAVSAGTSFSRFAGQDSPAAPQAAGGPSPGSGPDSSTEPKKTKKVWTNENLTDVSGSAISQIGDAKNGSPGKSASAKPASSQVVTS